MKRPFPRCLFSVLPSPPFESLSFFLGFCQVDLSLVVFLFPETSVKCCFHIVALSPVFAEPVRLVTELQREDLLSAEGVPMKRQWGMHGLLRLRLPPVSLLLLLLLLLLLKLQTVLERQRLVFSHLSDSPNQRS